jgi:hypothetical protein
MTDRESSRSGSASSWDNEDQWWQTNFTSRPYVQSGLGYEHYRPAYRYGYESGSHSMGRSWSDVEHDLRSGWAKFEGRSETESTWEDIKDAVRDAWHRVTGQSDMDTGKLSDTASHRAASRRNRTL